MNSFVDDQSSKQVKIAKITGLVSPKLREWRVDPLLSYASLFAAVRET